VNLRALIESLPLRSKLSYGTCDSTFTTIARALAERSRMRPVQLGKWHPSFPAEICNQRQLKNWGKEAWIWGQTCINVSPTLHVPRSPLIEQQLPVNSPQQITE